jgi:hypothetical protein
MSAHLCLSTVSAGQLVIFDLIDIHNEWNGQDLFDYVVDRFKATKSDVSSFPCRISVPNLSKQRSLFNNTSYRNKQRIACSRFRDKIGCGTEVGLFDFFYPILAEQVIPAVPIDPRRNDKRKIDTLQKKVRRLKTKCELIKRENIELSKKMKLTLEQQREHRRSTAKRAFRISLAGDVWRVTLKQRKSRQ